MKKYVKPELFYEQFELSQHIAACSMALNHGADDCSLREDSPEYDVFGELFADLDVCEVLPPEDYCYEAGMGGSALFTS